MQGKWFRKKYSVHQFFDKGVFTDSDQLIMPKNLNKVSSNYFATCQRNSRIYGLESISFYFCTARWQQKLYCRAVEEHGWPVNFFQRPKVVMRSPFAFYERLVAFEEPIVPNMWRYMFTLDKIFRRWEWASMGLAIYNVSFVIICQCMQLGINDFIFDWPNGISHWNRGIISIYFMEHLFISMRWTLNQWTAYLILV